MLPLQLGPEDPLATRLEPRADKGYGLLGFEPVYFWLERVDNRLSDCHPSALAKPLMWLYTLDLAPPLAGTCEAVEFSRFDFAPEADAPAVSVAEERVVSHS